jgi:hypothetical protein
MPNKRSLLLRLFTVLTAVLHVHSHAFVGSILSKAANTGESTAVEKETCFACDFILRKAYEIMQSSAPAGQAFHPSSDDYVLALRTACDNVPLVFLQGVR